MSIEAKATFMNELEGCLGKIVTVANMNAILTVVSDLLCDFQIEVTRHSDDKPDDMLDAYVSALKVEGRSDKTIARYKYIITRFMNAVGVKTRQVTVYHLRKYLSDEKGRGIADRTLEGYREIFSAYFNWLWREGLIMQNPTANLGVVKYRKQIKEAYSEIDIEKLKSVCENIRDKAIICFLLSTGCRINEVVQLNRDSVDLKNLECKVLGKGDKERTVFIDEVTGMLLSEYLKQRRDDEEALFAGLKIHKRMTPSGIRAKLHKIAFDANVENVHPHRFRRTLATTLTAHGMPIQEVANILGHEKLDTTMKYVVLDKSAVKNSYRKYR